VYNSTLVYNTVKLHKEWNKYAAFVAYTAHTQKRNENTSAQEITL
jgi:hypothetical protein